MRIVSFNINSIRARPHQLIHLRDTLNPDIIGLQETKVNDPDFPLEVIEEIGYHPEYWGQKGHYGVAFLSKDKPIKTVKGFEDDTEDDQKRFIQCTFRSKSSEITIMNGYFPQGENIHHETKFPKKIKYYDDLHKHIKALKKTEKKSHSTFNDLEKNYINGLLETYTKDEARRMIYGEWLDLKTEVIYYAYNEDKVVFNEQHQHTIMFAIKKEKVKEGGGAEAPPACKEKVVVLML